MGFDKRFHCDFPSDLAVATTYYDSISPILGNRFRDQVRETIGEVVERPESFGFARGQLRFASVGRFPYLILFQIVDATIFIAGLYHASSDPARWLKRTE